MLAIDPKIICLGVVEGAGNHIQYYTMTIYRSARPCHDLPSHIGLLLEGTLELPTSHKQILGIWPVQDNQSLVLNPMFRFAPLQLARASRQQDSVEVHSGSSNRKGDENAASV